MRWLRKTLAAFIGANSGTFQYDEALNPSLLAKKMNRIIRFVEISRILDSEHKRSVAPAIKELTMDYRLLNYGL